MLHEAEVLAASRREQALRAEARATTLQASAGIAIGLAFTGSAFLLDPTKIDDRLWRIALTVFLAALLFCLGMAGYLANRATAKLFTYRQPSPKEVLGRAGMPEAQAQWERGVALLEFVGKNTYFSAFKIHQVRVAGLWLRGALACFAALAVLLVVYAAVGPIPA